MRRKGRKHPTMLGLAVTLAVSAIGVLGIPRSAAAQIVDDALATCMARERSAEPSAEVTLDWTDLESMYESESVARRYSNGWRVVVADPRCKRYSLSRRDGRALDRLLARPNLKAELQSANDQKCTVIGGAGASIEVRTRSRTFRVDYADTTCRSAPQTKELMRLIARD